MTHLIYLYDAVKKLNMILPGERDTYDRKIVVLIKLEDINADLIRQEVLKIERLKR